MAEKQVGFNLDALINLALDKVENCYRYDNLSENGDLESNVLEKLPEDFDYIVEILDGSEKKFKLRVTTSNITTESLNGLLVEFQAMNDVCVKIKMAKKPTKGCLIQNYYRCHHNTRKWSPSKDPQRKLRTNPTARVKTQIAHLRWL